MVGADVACEAVALADLATTCRLLERTPFDLLPLRHATFETAEAAAVLTQAAQEAKELRAERNRLAQAFALDTSPLVEELDIHVGVLEGANFLSPLFSSDYRQARRYFQKLSNIPARKSRTQMATQLRELRQLLDSINSFETNPDYRSILDVHFKGLDTDFAVLGRLVSWYSEVSEALAVDRCSSRALMTAMFRAPADRLEKVHRFSTTRVETRHELDAFAQRGLAQVTETLPEGAVRAANDHLSKIVIELRQMARLAGKILAVSTDLGIRDDCKIDGLAATIERLKAHQNRRRELEQHPAGAILGSRFLGVRTDVKPIEACLNVLWQIGACSLPSAVKHWLLDGDVATRLQQLRQGFDLLDNRLVAFRGVNAAFCQQADLAYTQWYEVKAGGLRLADIQARCDRALAEPEALPPWLDFLRARDQVEQAGLQDLCELAEARNIQIEDLLPAYRFAFYNTLTRSIFEDRPELRRFTGLTQEAVREQFIRYDKEVINLNRRRMAKRIDRLPHPGNRSGPVREWTDFALIENEISKKKRHIPIRRLVYRAARALQSLKPCFMMSPLSVAQYLVPGQLHFDMVVMDEASQLKPEDALGAIARSGQLVVVGDPKQLPPSTFFERRLEGDEGEDADAEDERLSVEEHESILDVASALYQPIRQLRWHYRSRHGSLIAFSNREFYSSRLVLFPSPFRDRPDLGVKFRYVEDGLYDERRNRPEAERVVNAILNHINTHPQDSLGVVALNFEQRELIEELLNERARHDAVCQHYLEQQPHAAEPFFIKNLENVQGDERDVIVISVTYGRDAKGNLFQRFGPINQAQGPRRLNVLFTRAKKRILVFSSIDPDQLRVDSTSQQGIRILKAYLAYAKTGYLETTEYGKLEPANDFEISVGNALKERGFDIEYQFGVSGFFIDIAIRHPKKLGTFVLGVECDGATYHSARSVRDRDRLRQSILENLGWRVKRVWSTDWFKDSKRETQKVVDRVEEILRSELLSA